jgi:decaprenyl-phosphate phosphoribosyltransferase
VVVPAVAKELPYIDVITESVNGPIRILLGWYAVTTECSPPLALLFSSWTLTAFMMTGKRYAEYRFIGSRMRAAAYRSSFRWYNERSLTLAMIGYAVLSVIFFVILVVGSAQLRLLVMLPYIAVFIVWFIKLSARKDSVVREPERIWKDPAFAVYSLGIVILFAVLGLARTPFF